MGNIKNANRITLAFGKDMPAKVLDFAIRDFGRISIDAEEPEDVPITQVTIEDEQYIVVDTDTPRGELLMAIECLHDHIHSVPEEELRQRIEEPDYHCANPDHIGSMVACHNSQEDCLSVAVYSFIYYAPDYLVEAYYVIPA